MTIDSAYQLELYAPDNDCEYFFEFESTGNTTFILWIDYTDNGVPARVSLSPGTGDFDIEFEGRDPIYKRGKITLTDQFFQAFEGLEITRLTMQRKTPIFKDVTFEANGAWSSEGFEFEIDKICLIQQEIEGHYCDCREQEQGLDPIENVVEEEYYEQVPECEPYACNAFKLAAAATAEYYWPGDNDTQGDGFLAGTVNIPVGFGDTAALQTSAWLPDGCAGQKHQEGTIKPIDETQVENPGIFFGPNFNFFCIARGNGTAYFNLDGQYLRDPVAPGGFRNVGVSIHVSGDGSILSLSILNTSVMKTISTPWPNDGQPHLIGFRVSGLPDTFTVSGSYLAAGVLEATYELYLDGELKETTTFDHGNSSANNGLYRYGDGLEGGEKASRRLQFTGGRWSDRVINGNISALNLAWLRNQADYQPPEYCIFPQG